MALTGTGPAHGTTPLSAEDLEGLRLPLSTREQLDAAEQVSIARASRWIADYSRSDGALDDDFLRQLHRMMFGDVWKWAGSYRQRDVNIGNTSPSQIAMEVRNALADSAMQVSTRAYPPDEIAVRMHHRLVRIHPFPNGNGRVTREMADIQIARLEGRRFSWGALATRSSLRDDYIAALHCADGGNIKPLLEFARS